MAIATIDGSSFITVDGWIPARINELLNVHWSVAARRKNEDKQAVAFAARGFPKQESRVRVHMSIFFGPKKRRGDPDAYWKSALDALKHAGVIVDDSDKWLVLGEVKLQRAASSKTIFCVEPLPIDMVRCLTFGCRGTARRRGLCTTCYKRMRLKVKSGSLSWQEAEKRGLVLPAQAKFWRMKS